MLKRLGRKGNKGGAADWIESVIPVGGNKLGVQTPTPLITYSVPPLLLPAKVGFSLKRVELKRVWRLVYPVRQGEHPNTAFGLALALDYTRAPQVSVCQYLSVIHQIPIYNQSGDRVGLGGENPCKCHKLLLGGSVWNCLENKNRLCFAGLVRSPMNQVAPTFSPHVFRFLIAFCPFLQDLTSLLSNWCYDWHQFHDFPTGGRSYGKGASRRHCFQVPIQLLYEPSSHQTFSWVFKVLTTEEKSWSVSQRF